jgi:hypothetical protein
MKKILFITHEDIDATPVARSMFLDVANDVGRSADVVVCSGGGLGGEAAQHSAGVTQWRFSRKRLGGLSIRDVISFYSYIWLRKSEIFGFDKIWVRSYPAMLGLAMLSIFYKVPPLVFDTRGLFFDELYDARKLSWRALLGIFRRLEVWMLKVASVVVCVTDSQKEYYIKLSGQIADSFVVLPNAAPQIDAERVQDTRIPGVLQIGYVGSMGVWHCPEFMYEFVAELIRRGVALEFHVVTPEVAKAKVIFSNLGDFVKIYAAAYRYEPIRFDVGLCFIKDSLAKRVCFPVKYCEYLAAGVRVMYSSNVMVCDSISRQYICGYGVSLEEGPRAAALRLHELIAANGQNWRDNPIGLPGVLKRESVMLSISQILEIS